MAVEKHEAWEEDLAFLGLDRVTKETPTFPQGVAAPAFFLCVPKPGIPVSVETNCTVAELLLILGLGQSCCLHGEDTGSQIAPLYVIKVLTTINTSTVNHQVQNAILSLDCGSNLVKSNDEHFITVQVPLGHKPVSKQ